MPLTFRVTLPKNAARRAACGTPERREGAMLSAKGSRVGVGGFYPPTGGGSGGPPHESFSFANTLRESFTLSDVHI